MALRPEPICAPEGAETLWLFLSFSVQSFPVETASTNALLYVAKSRRPPPLRLFPCWQLTRRRMAESVAHEVRLQQETPVEKYVANIDYSLSRKKRLWLLRSQPPSIPMHQCRGFTEAAVKASCGKNQPSAEVDPEATGRLPRRDRRVSGFFTGCGTVSQTC